MAKKDKKATFHSIVKDKKLPILTLDSRWHELFGDDVKTEEIKNLEQKVNTLLKRQGKLVNDIKDMKSLKNNLLKDIMANMEVGRESSAKDKKLGKNKQLINEINDKIESAMDELGDLPYTIKEVNAELMAESIKSFYGQLEHNKEELREVSDWINNIREELKHKILLKQDIETKNNQIYTYMHDILGVELMELFDHEYNNKK